jgi:hypothetical protein
VNTGNNDYELNISSTYQTDDSLKKFEQMEKYGKQTNELQNGVTIVRLNMRGPDGQIVFLESFQCKNVQHKKGHDRWTVIRKSV